MSRHEPRVALANRAHLKVIIAIPPAEGIEELEPNLLKLASHMERDHTMVGMALDKDLTVTALVKSCVKELRDKLELSTKYMSDEERGEWRNCGVHGEASGLHREQADPSGDWESGSEWVLSRHRYHTLQDIAMDDEPQPVRSFEDWCGGGGAELDLNRPERKSAQRLPRKPVRRCP